MSATSILRRRLAWLMGARVVVGTVLLGTAVLLQLAAPGTLPADPFFLLIALTFALTLVYAVTRTQAERHAWLIALQLGLDAAMVSAFVFLTGGISSYFPALYVLPVIGGSMLLSRRGGMWLALLCTTLYAGIVSGQYFAASGHLPAWWLGPAALPLPSARLAQYTMATNVFAFFAVAALSGSLADGQRSADSRLQQASSAIADLKALNQHVIDSLTSGLATTDRAGCLLTFNRAAEAITGRLAPAVIGGSAARVLQLPSEFEALLDRDLDGAESRRADYVYRTGDGVTRDIGLSAAHLLTPGGRAGYLLTFQDVTEIRRIEREGRRKQRLAAVGEMAAGIAHEIRNPLASLRGSIQVLRQELALNDEQAQLMDIVLRESERLNETIRSFLAYARPQRQVSTRVDVGRMLRDTAALLRNSPEVRDDHRIEVEVTPDDVWCEADENQMRQVVWNLATNAVRAMPHGGRLALVARLDGENGELVLQVDDEGVGIPTEDLDGLFQPFRGNFEGGTGLGLAIVHRIASDHDGEVQIESQPGRGTSVRVRLPLPAAVPA
jgi:two-component system sensor histidine kinase PilS (NtrC family)